MTRLDVPLAPPASELRPNAEPFGSPGARSLRSIVRRGTLRSMIGYGGSELLEYAVSAFAVARAGLKGWPRELRLTGWVLATAALGWCAASFAAHEGGSRYTSAALAFVAVTLAWTPLGLAFLSQRRVSLRAEVR